MSPEQGIHPGRRVPLHLIDYVDADARRSPVGVVANAQEYETDE
ncbi:hypothetical protein ACLMAL_16755 [Nocardia sp. CWNU-33]